MAYPGVGYWAEKWLFKLSNTEDGSEDDGDEKFVSSTNWVESSESVMIKEDFNDLKVWRSSGEAVIPDWVDMVGGEIWPCRVGGKVVEKQRELNVRESKIVTKRCDIMDMSKLGI